MQPATKVPNAEPVARDVVADGQAVAARGMTNAESAAPDEAVDGRVVADLKVHHVEPAVSNEVDRAGQMREAVATPNGVAPVVLEQETVEATDNAPTRGVEERRVPTPATRTARYSDWIARVVMSTAKVAIRARSEIWKPRNAATRPMPGKSRPL